VAGWQQQKLRDLRWRNGRIEDQWQEQRKSLAALTELLAEGAQAAAWLGWAATVMPAAELSIAAADYRLRMRALLPRLFGSRPPRLGSATRLTRLSTPSSSV